MNNAELLKKYNECQPIIEEMDDAISEMFTKYCEIFGIHRAYGIEKWDINHDIIDITQDTTAMSCYNTEDHALPIAYLLDENAEDIMRRDAEDEKSQRNARRLANAERDFKTSEGILHKMRKRYMS